MEERRHIYVNEGSIQNLQAEYSNRKSSTPGDLQELEDADTVFHVSKKDDMSDDISTQSSLSDVNSNNQSDEFSFVEQLLYDRKLDDIVGKRPEIISKYLQCFQDELRMIDLLRCFKELTWTCAGTSKFSEALKIFDTKEDTSEHQILQDVKFALQKEFAMYKIKRGSPESAICFLTESLKDTCEPAWFLCARSRYSRFGFCMQKILFHVDRAFHQLGDIHSAMLDAEACIDKFPGLFEGYERLYQISTSINDFQSVRSLMDKISELFHDHPKAATMCSDDLFKMYQNKAILSNAFVKNLLVGNSNHSMAVLRRWDSLLLPKYHSSVLKSWTSAMTDCNEERLLLEWESPPRSSEDFDGSSSPDFSSNGDSGNSSPIMLSSKAVEDKLASGIAQKLGACNSKITKINRICAACFRATRLNNRFLFLRIAIEGWKALNKLEYLHQERASIQLCLGYSYLYCLSSISYVESETELEDHCVSYFQRAVNEIDKKDKNTRQLQAAYVGLGEYYKYAASKESNPRTWLKSADYLCKAFELYAKDAAPKDVVSAMLEIGKLPGCFKEAIDYLKLATSNLPRLVAEERLSLRCLEAEIHLNMADAFVMRSSTENTGGELERAIDHYSKALDVFTYEAFPLQYAKAQVKYSEAKLQLLDFRDSAMICLRQVDMDDRKGIQDAQERFESALAVAETLASITLGSAGGSRRFQGMVWSTLKAAFTGCVKTCLLLGKPAQALSYAERCHGYSFGQLLLSEASRGVVLNNLSEKMRSSFEKMQHKVERLQRESQDDHVSSLKKEEALFKYALQLLSMREKVAMQSKEGKASMLRFFSPLDDEHPCLWMSDPVEHYETAIVEWYIGDKMGFVFFKEWREDSPRVMCYSEAEVEQIDRCLENLSLDGQRFYSDKLVELSVALRVKSLVKMVSPRVKRLILIPEGRLAQVPLHALPLDEQDESEDRACMLDRFPLGVAYSPSIKYLSWSQHRDINTRFAPMLKVLAIGKPRDGQACSNIENEWKALRSCFRKMRVISDIEVHSAKINEDLHSMMANEVKVVNVSSRNADVLHFSCHSHSKHSSSSSLLIPMADGEVLGGDRISSWDLPVCRVVVLATNEQVRSSSSPPSSLLTSSQSNLPDSSALSGSPDISTVAWPLGFLIAGSNCVVTSHWVVDHECRAIFWNAFYDRLIHGGLDVASALRDTQVKHEGGRREEEGGERREERGTSRGC
eukprot:763179-Hanusia_phi.AAC.9